jgi:hypothetical protein
MITDDPTGSGLSSILDEPSDALADPVPDERLAPPRQADPTGTLPRPTVVDTVEAEVGAVPIVPIYQNISGRYRGTAGSFQIELRVDIDRAHPLRKVSGDFYSVSGSTVTYFGSFVVDSPVVTTTTTAITARGLGRFTFAAGAPVVQVTIPRRRILQPAAPATLRFFTTSNAPGATYICPFESGYFRTVQIETDRVSDVTTPVFSSYNTGSLPSGGSTRNLSVVSAYAEAGIQMLPTARSDVIDISEAGLNKTWSDSELHASMVRHFSLFRDVPQWSVWQVVCQLHDLGPGLYGIMFDQLGAQRQGCAVFHAGIGGITADKLRLQLYTYVHELGHCFNLLHSWQKSFANPPGVNRPSALSFMNYPWNYPGGPNAFWSAFPFQFDDPELIHLRHAFRNNIIMGGNPFATGAAVIDPDLMADAMRDESGLDFKITPVHAGFALGEPVVIKLELRCHDRRGKTVQPYLHPKASMTSIAITKPGGQTVLYEPFIDHLMADEQRFMAGDEVIEESAYIGFGKGGLYFDQPGIYKLRAAYQAADGSQVMSNVVTLRVRYPTTAKEEQLAELLMGDEQGALFWLLGSESESLSNGRAALDEVLAKHSDHPLANYVRLIRGVNLSRTYVIISGHHAERVELRRPVMDESHTLLTAATAPNSRVDDLSKLMCLGRLAHEQRRLGDTQGADATATRMQGLRSTRR